MADTAETSNGRDISTALLHHFSFFLTSDRSVQVTSSPTGPTNETPEFTARVDALTKKY